MANLSFLILNYKNVGETIKCVESIQNTYVQNYSIVVVDNGSGDGSYEKMYELYGKTDGIYVIKSDKNIGFSAGNNLGYKFVREKLHPDFLIVTNNDVLFPQKDMDQKIQNIYEQTGFHVLGPDIYVRHNHEHQSPIMLTLPSKADIERELHMYKYYLQNPQKWVSRRKIQNLKNRVCQSNELIKKIYCKIKKKEPIDYTVRHLNCCVQGACIIVSKKFIDVEEKMFTPEPFLYCEELFLYKRCINKGYKIVYEPKIQVWHEDSSTMKRINSGEIEKAKFTLKYHVESRRMLLDYFCEGERIK